PDFAVGRVSLDDSWRVALLSLDHIDPELGVHRHCVLDLLRGYLILRQGSVQLVIGQVTSLLAASQHLLDRSGKSVEQRRLRRLLTGFRHLSRIRRLAHHPTIPRQYLLTLHSRKTGARERFL